MSETLGRRQRRWLALPRRHPRPASKSAPFEAIAIARCFCCSGLKCIDEQNGSSLFLKAGKSGCFERRSRTIWIDHDCGQAGSRNPNARNAILLQRATENDRSAIKIGDYVIGNLDCECLPQPITKESGILKLAVLRLRGALPQVKHTIKVKGVRGAGCDSTTPTSSWIIGTEMSCSVSSCPSLRVGCCLAKNR